MKFESHKLGRKRLLKRIKSHSSSLLLSARRLSSLPVSFATSDPDVDICPWLAFIWALTFAERNQCQLHISLRASHTYIWWYSCNYRASIHTAFHQCVSSSAESNPTLSWTSWSTSQRCKWKDSLRCEFEDAPLAERHPLIDMSKFDTCYEQVSAWRAWWWWW